MKKPQNPRVLFAAIGLLSLAFLVTAWQLQYGPQKQQPCPLCILQRYDYIALAVVGLMAAMHGAGRTGTMVYAAIVDLVATLGAGLAMWQVTKGSSMTSCLQDPIGTFVVRLPPADWFPEYFFPNGGCADQYPPILGISVPQWSLMWFMAFAAAATYILFMAARKESR